MRFLRLMGLMAAVAGSALRADPAAELARLHLEAIGGARRVEALSSMRVTGHVVAGGTQMRFTLLAARPARVRIETEKGGRTLVQGSDGVEAPWEYDTGSWPPKYREMSAGASRVFQSDSEFDDPLVAGADRGFTFDYAGEMMVDGRKLLRVLVTRKLSETFSVLLDDETSFIVKRVEHRESAGGRKLQVVTHYDDFRPVDGLLLPHTITLAIDGRATQQTKIARIEPNPGFDPGSFSRPRMAPPAPRVP